eukprot:3936320-Rhodomonas_salina.1
MRPHPLSLARVSDSLVCELRALSSALVSGLLVRDPPRTVPRSGLGLAGPTCADTCADTCGTLRWAPGMEPD